MNKTNEIFSIWVNNEPNNLNYRCWNSWLRQGYSVVLLTDDLQLLKDVELSSKIELILITNLGVSFDIPNKENLLQYIDLWRFIYLKDYGGTWLDSDMYLTKRLPESEIIISSEHTLQAGGRKSKDLYRPNIGCLRFPPNHPFVEEVVRVLTPFDKKDDNPNVNQTSKMMKFINLLKKTKWVHMNEYVVEPQVFCPVPYPFAKELFMNHYQNARVKYGLKFDYRDDTTCGVHLWENLTFNKHKIDLNNIHPQSLYQRLSPIDYIHT